MVGFVVIRRVENAMKWSVTNIKQIIKGLRHEKGQGLVEFVLILAFCAAIGYAAREAGFGEAISALLGSGEQPEYVTAAIGGSGLRPSSGDNPGGGDEPPDDPREETPAYGAGIGYSGHDWGTIVPNNYFEKEYQDENASLDGGKTTIDFTTEASQADRLAADQKALENLARFFIGKSQEQIAGLLNNIADMGVSGDVTEIMLGHIQPKDTKNPTNPGMRMTDTGQLKVSSENIFKWMKNPYDPDSVEYDPNYNYLVSDYVVSQGWVSSVSSGSNQKNGLKLRLEYDYSGKFAPEGGYANAGDVKVIGAHVAIDPKSQDNDALGQVSQYNRKSSSGLDVQVRMNADGSIYVTQNDTGVKVTADNATNTSGQGMYNWYGESDYKLVKQYIADHVATTITNTEKVEMTFTKGDIIYVPEKNAYYVAMRDGTQQVSNSSVGEYNTNNATNKNNVLVKFETSTARYWHENDKTEYDAQNHCYGPKYIKARGTVLTMDNGDMYVYTGDRTSNSNNLPFEGINDDWLKFGNIRTD